LNGRIEEQVMEHPNNKGTKQKNTEKTRNLLGTKHLAGKKM